VCVTCVTYIVCARATTRGSGRTPGSGGGAYELVYAPNTSPAAVAVAEAAAADLVCGAPDGSEPSFMQQVALASNVEVNVQAIMVRTSAPVVCALKTRPLLLSDCLPIHP
jgi:hypothetical protein